MSNFGHFSNDGSEYVITETNTPRPLLNYIWNSRILSGINHFGGGNGSYGGRAASYIDSEGKGRAVLIRDGNRYFYIRDEETGEFWNPGWFPAKRELSGYSCTHGLGYSYICGAFGGINARIRIFVNHEDPVEICSLLIRNNSKRVKRLRVYSFVDFSLEGYSRYSEYDSYVFSEFDKEHNMIIAHNTAQERPHEWFDGFAASSLGVTGFETSRRVFLGTYGDITEPETIVRGSCRNSLAACELMVGVLENCFELDSEEEVSYDVLFGSTCSRQDAVKTVEKLFTSGKIESDFLLLQASKTKMIRDIEVATPDSKINYITNIWAKQQIQLCAEVGRATGKGFRDQLQDSWGVCSFNKSLASEKILETLMHQYKDGKCVRGWLPLDHHIYSDGPTWIAPTVNAYLKETGDYGFLDCRVPFLDEGESTVWGHILAAARYSSSDLGERNLVLAHDGDWNDSLNGIGVGGRGESVWTSIALYHALINTAEIALGIYNDKTISEEMLGRAAKIKQAVNDNGWDGEWYLAGYNDKGEKVGSHLEKEGRIYLNSQTWAVMSGIADGERKVKCLKAVDSILDSPFGPLTLYPPYTSYNQSIGRLTGFVPGIWENGTPYCHGGAFKIVADCCAGRGNNAYETLSKIIPDSIQNPSEHSGGEPYVYTNMYFGPDNPRAGQTSFAWVTGTAGWMFRIVTQYMMGFHPGYDHIIIKPCIPDCWEECSMKRVFRGDTYIIRIKNNKSQSRINRILLDGVMQYGNSFPIFGDKAVHDVYIEMG